MTKEFVVARKDGVIGRLCRSKLLVPLCIVWEQSLNAVRAKRRVPEHKLDSLWKLSNLSDIPQGSYNLETYK